MIEAAPSLYRLAAFAETPGGGNPAGVWIGDALPDAATMQRVAAEVGYSETAFVAPQSGRSRVVRYYSPLAEVSFCGHATIAAGVVLGRNHGPGDYRFQTVVGDVAVTVRRREDRLEAALTSVATRQREVPASCLEQVMALLGWARGELDPAIPPVFAYAGAWHLVLAADRQGRLDRLAYDFDAMKSLMLSEDLTTLQLIWRQDGQCFHARNPFPVGGVVEDPATGAAAAALGGYLRDAGLVRTPASFVIRQGEAMGRPSALRVEVPRRGGVMVAGGALGIEPASV